MALTALVDRIHSTVPERFHDSQPWVWITGGEPTDHDIQPLIDALQPWRVALATSGVGGCQWPGVRWMSVSPHKRIDSISGQQLHGHELKLTPGLGSLTWHDCEQVRQWASSFAWRYLSPLAGSPDDLARAVSLVTRDPGWQLTIQAHKEWGLQ